ENCEVVIYRNQAADFELTPATFDPSQVDRAPTLVATGTALALDPSRSTTIAALQRTGFGILDLDYRAYTWAGEDEARRVYFEAIEACQAVVGNDDEFGLLASPGETGEDVAQRLSEQRPAGFVVYKMGERGSVTFAQGRRFTTRIYAVDVLKPFGAGDAFMGGLLARVLAGDALEDAVDFASAAAAMVVSREGCAQAMPTTDAVQAFIAAHKGR
ncbi:MAG: PfkB family carbohydrate kinase, partial [Pseudomonadota bacterium]|nr:PfkB family carbohydrate kinase [Pseudomonadota bacterium]